MQRIKTVKTLTRAASAALFLSVQALICIGTVYWAIAETLGMAGTAALVLGAHFCFAVGLCPLHSRAHGL